MSYTDYSDYYDADCNQVQNLTNSKIKCQALWYCYCDDNCEKKIESCTNLFKPLECANSKGKEYYEYYYNQISIPCANYQDPSCAQNFIVEIFVSNIQIPNIVQTNEPTIGTANNLIIRTITNDSVTQATNNNLTASANNNLVIRTTSSNSITQTANNSSGTNNLITKTTTSNNLVTRTTTNSVAGINNNLVTRITTGPIIETTNPMIETTNSTIRTINNLMIEPTQKFDSKLINPWGIIIINDYVWIANTGSGLITVYNIRGETMMLPITVYCPDSIVAQPTGLTHNSNNNSFIVSSGLLSGSATIIIVTLDGTIHGYNNLVDPRNSILAVNNIGTGAIYTGAVIVKNILYIANFGNNKIDVFDDKFMPLTGYLFLDQHYNNPIPVDFFPYNIVNIGDYLYVIYVKQNPNSKLEVLGSSNGYINIFALNGQFVRRFVSCKDLNVPWGLIEAPSIFYYPPGTILVGNFGNGKINVYAEDGRSLGRILDGNYNEICIDALRGLSLNTNHDFQIYFTSTSYNLKNGRFGNIHSGNIQ